jgi:DNA topoisomerase IA
MTDQIVITEKTSQAKDVRAAVGPRYGVILPAEGHLFDLLEPEDGRWCRATIKVRHVSALPRLRCSHLPDCCLI